MKRLMNVVALFLITPVLVLSISSCGKSDNKSQTSSTIETVSSVAPTPSPSPSPTPVPRLVKSVRYIDPTVGVGTSGGRYTSEKDPVGTYIYDENGQVVEVDEESFHFEITRNYNADGLVRSLVVQETREKWNETFTHEYKYYYDDSGRLRSDKNESYSCWREYTYDENDRLIETQYTFGKNSKETVFRTTYDYDEAGFLVSDKTELVSGEDGEFYFIECLYDRHVNEEFYISGDSSTQYYYQDGVLVKLEKTVRIPVDERIETLYEVIEYEYDESGSHTERKGRILVDENNQIIPGTGGNTVEFVYDEKGFIQSYALMYDGGLYYSSKEECFLIDDTYEIEERELYVYYYE